MNFEQKFQLGVTVSVDFISTSYYSMLPRKCNLLTGRLGAGLGASGFFFSIGTVFCGTFKRPMGWSLKIFLRSLK